jgi:hypothetical protein
MKVATISYKFGSGSIGLSSLNVPAVLLLARMVKFFLELQFTRRTIVRIMTVILDGFALFPVMDGSDLRIVWTWIIWMVIITTTSPAMLKPTANSVTVGSL